MKVTETLLRLVFPPKCIFCKKILHIGRELEICTNCFEKINFIKKPLFIDNNLQIQDPTRYSIACVCEYSSIIKDVIVKYKFLDKPSFCRAFGLLLAQRVLETYSDIKFDMLVSVPLHKKREKERGYNQANLIAQQVSSITGIKNNSKVIKRVINTKPQSLLGKEERQGNLDNAFTIVKPEVIKEKTILLIDDVLTTGATLEHCIKSLKHAGAKNIYGAVIATGRTMFIYEIQNNL